MACGGVCAAMGDSVFGVLGKRPRHYAQEITLMKTREERAAALSAAPGWAREIIKEHVISEFERRKYR